MVIRANKTLTADEFYALPECNAKYELVRGHLVREPLPGAQHGAVALRIGVLLNDYLRVGGRRGVVIVGDAAFELFRMPDTVRGPDVAFVSIERWEALEDVRKAVPGAPDLAVEVRSPSRSARAMAAKAADYLAAGGAEVWVVDPRAVAATVFHPECTPVTLTADEVLSSPAVLPGFAAPVHALMDITGPTRPREDTR